MTNKNNASAVAKNSSNASSSNEVKTVLEKDKIQIPQFIALESTIGAISLLAMRSQSHKYLFLSDLEWLLLPAVSQKQFRIFRNNKNEPIAFVSWANIDDAVEKRLLDGSLKLQPKDWNSGSKKYVIDVISPFVAVKEILKELKSNHFKDEEIKIMRPKKDGKGFDSVMLEEFLA